MKKKIVIFSEYSKEIGHGHLIRSKRIYNKLKIKYNVELLINKNLKFIKKKIVSENNQLIIIDFKNYHTNISNFNKKNFYFFFETKKNFGKNSLSIDALNLSGKKYTGPKWYPYPENFFLKTIKRTKKKQKKYNVLISQGFTDAHSNLVKVCSALLPLKKALNLNLFVKTNNNINLPKQFLKTNGIKEINFKKNISNVYRNIDVAITGAGNTCFELNFFNIKCMYITGEKREIKRAKILEKMKFGYFCNINNNKEFLKKFVKTLNNKKNSIKKKNFFNHNGMLNITNLIKKYEN